MKTASVLPVLMYHHISPAPGLVTVSPDNFRAQMQDLARAGWHTVGTADIAAFLSGKALPARSVAITFDDGYLDNYIHAYPVLREYGLYATIFVVTDWLTDGPVRQIGGDIALPDHRGCKAAIAAGRTDEVMLRWSEIEAMQADGVVEVHSHTHSHTRWDRMLPDIAARRAALAADLRDSRAILQRRLGLEDRHLCWPQGYFDEDYVAVAQDCGFMYLYTTRRRLNYRTSSATSIGRIDTRDKGSGWLVPRLYLYTMPLIGELYSCIREGR